MTRLSSRPHLPKSLRDTIRRKVADRVLEDLREIGPPDLLRPPEVPGDAGDAKWEEVFRTVEVRLLEALFDRVSRYRVVSGPSLPAIGPSARWTVISCLQKAIRRGDVDVAFRAAEAMLKIDQDYLFRRLSVIALEDIGVGNLLACAMALACAGKRQWRYRLGNRWLALYLTQSLCESPKDRLAANLLSFVSYNSGLDADDRNYPFRPEAWLSDRMRDRNASLEHRLLAAWSLAGTRRYECALLPVRHRPVDHVLRAFRMWRLPLIMSFLIEKSARRQGNAMFLTLPFIWQVLEASSFLREEERALPSVEEIGGLLSCAYDIFTRDGQAAFRYFLKACDDIAPFIAGLSYRQRMELMGHGVFISEGGILDRRLIYEGSEALYGQAEAFELSHAGLLAERHTDFLATLRRNLPLLNAARRRVLGRGKGGDG